MLWLDGPTSRKGWAVYRPWLVAGAFLRAASGGKSHHARPARTPIQRGAEIAALRLRPLMRVRGRFLRAFVVHQHDEKPADPRIDLKDFFVVPLAAVP